MKHKKPVIGAWLLVICCVLTGIMIFAFIHGKQRDTYNNIPIGESSLAWGMKVEEIIEILGEPTVKEKEGSGTTLTYCKKLQSTLGTCSELVLAVEENDLNDNNQQQISSGLCYIMMEIEATTKESVLEKLVDFYGALSADGGSTQMELSLKQANPFYFNESHFCEEWRIENLSDDV